MNAPSPASISYYPINAASSKQEHDWNRALLSHALGERSVNDDRKPSLVSRTDESPRRNGILSRDMSAVVTGLVSRTERNATRRNE